MGNLWIYVCLLDSQKCIEIFKSSYRHLIPQFFYFKFFDQPILGPTSIFTSIWCNIKQLLLIVYTKHYGNMAVCSVWTLSWVKQRQILLFQGAAREIKQWQFSGDGALWEIKHILTSLLQLYIIFTIIIGLMLMLFFRATSELSRGYGNISS